MLDTRLVSRGLLGRDGPGLALLGKGNVANMVASARAASFDVGCELEWNVDL